MQANVFSVKNQSQISEYFCKPCPNLKVLHQPNNFVLPIFLFEQNSKLARKFIKKGNIFIKFCQKKLLLYYFFDIFAILDLKVMKINQSF